MSLTCKCFIRTLRARLACTALYCRFVSRFYIIYIALYISTALFSTCDLETLAKEVSTMLSFKHKHVMSLVGVCIDGDMPLLIMPFMSNGSVLDYVKNHKDNLLITGKNLEEEVHLTSNNNDFIIIRILLLKPFHRHSQHVRHLSVYLCTLQKEWSISPNKSLFIETWQQETACMLFFVAASFDFAL